MSLERVLLVAAGAVAAAALLPPLPRRPWPQRRRRRESTRPAELVAIERHVALSVASTADLHERLCPLLRDIARDRLAAAGIDLDRSPDAAAHTLGDEAWELVRPDRPPPEDRHAAGIPPDRLRAIVDRLDAIGDER